MNSAIRNPHSAILQHHFYNYQWSWLQDRSPLKIGLWARQTGKDFTCAAEAVFECLTQPNSHWLIIACGERQAVESLEKSKLWAQATHTFVSEHTRTSPPPALIKTRELRFPNGSSITALPAKAETLRGYSANLILTEFAFHDRPDDIWRAVFPIITNPLRGGRKKLRIISTPSGQANLFHRLWLNPDFSKHKVTIHDATSAGLPIDLQLLRRGLADREAFSQEYECEFLDASHVLLPYELIESCESPDATESSTPQILSTLRGELFAGIDFGRKQDLTVCWLLEKLPNPNPTPNLVGTRSTASLDRSSQSAIGNRQSTIFLTREVLVLQNMSTPAQLELLRPRIARVRRACIDYTGAGVGLGDLLAAEFGANNKTAAKYTHRLAPPSVARIELCQFSAALKHELFPTLRAVFEQGGVLIPQSSAIREDLHGIHKFVSANGQVSFRATHTADGHSDRCTALALALRAAENAPPLACASTVEIDRRRRI